MKILIKHKFKKHPQNLKFRMMRKLRKINTNFRIENIIPRNYLNIYLSFISIISVSKGVKLEDIKSDIENQEFENHKFTEWFSWN